MLISNKIKQIGKIYSQQEKQLDIVNFESPLQQILQQHLTLLRLLNNQRKWQLWISVRPMLKRSWFMQSGLSEQKIMHLSKTEQDDIINIIEKALLSQKYSYIAACVHHLSESQRQRLQMAVKASGSHLFLIDDNFMDYNDFMTLSKQVQAVH